MRVQDLSPVRTVTSAKLVNNRLLNQLGLQVGRTVAARAIYSMRPAPRHPEHRDQMEVLQRDGMLCIQNFLGPDEFSAVKAECETTFSVADEPRITRRDHGPTSYEIARVGEYSDDEMPHAKSFFNSPKIQRLLESAEKTQLRQGIQHCVVERVTQGDTTLGDPETQLHSDVFFNTHKIWLYLTDVTPAAAPLVYVKGSHRLSMEQLRQIYRHSCDPTEQSRRILDDEMTARGLQEQPLECPANTLVVANVCGYHRRSVGQPGGQRMALHCSVRLQPFLRVLDRLI